MARGEPQQIRRCADAHARHWSTPSFAINANTTTSNTTRTNPAPRANAIRAPSTAPAVDRLYATLAVERTLSFAPSRARR